MSHQSTLARRRRPISFYVFVSIIVFALAATVFGVYSQQVRIDTAERLAQFRLELVQQKEAQLVDLLDKYTALADDCEEAADCQTTAPSPEVIERDLEDLRGAPGLQGDPGRPPSAGEISDAVRAYCTARTDCTGTAGADGAPGSPGTAGQNGTDGAAGAPGADGRDGIDGRSVANTQCIGEGDSSFWETTYSDGGTTTSPGPCRLQSGGIVIVP